MFWNNIQKLCSLHGVSPNKLCSDIGLSHATPTKWKSGAVPRNSTLKKISEYFNVSIDYLLTEKTPPQTEVSGIQIPNKLVQLYNELNEEGREKLLDYADDLVNSGKYKKGNEIPVGSQKDVVKAV